MKRKPKSKLAKKPQWLAPLKYEAPEGFLAPAVKLNPALYSHREVIRHAAETRREREGGAFEAKKAARRTEYIRSRHDAFKRRRAIGAANRTPPQR